MYTINDARREIKECFEEGYSFDYVRIFINDLRRGGDITKEESKQLFKELLEKNDYSFGTY